MARSSVTLTIQTNLLLLNAWLRFCRVAAYMIGPEIAMAWAYSGRWLVLYRIDGGRWRFLRR